MTKTLSDRLTQYTKQKKPSHSAYNRALFLALRPEIKQALDDGWPVKSIWEILVQEGKITFSYQAFLGYVNRLLLTAKTKNTPSSSAKTSRIISRKLVPMPGFTFNPIPNLKDLI